MHKIQAPKPIAVDAQVPSGSQVPTGTQAVTGSQFLNDPQVLNDRQVFTDSQDIPDFQDAADSQNVTDSQNATDSQTLSEVPAPTYRQIRCSGIDLLARREHSRHELELKLLLRYPASTMIIEEVLQDLQTELLQSDERFAESYVAMRRRKGYGPQRLRQELREKGIDPALAQAELGKPEHDWFGQAAVVLRKKFAVPGPEHKERAKQMRFLQYRGFSHDHIQAAMTLDCG